MDIKEALEDSDTIDDAPRDADAVMKATLDNEYSNIKAGDFGKYLKPGCIVFDVWRQYYGQDFTGLNYMAVGVRD